jgi:hypothetical protein
MRFRSGQVAQLVEHLTENQGVGGSTPSLATKTFNTLQPPPWRLFPRKDTTKDTSGLEPVASRRPRVRLSLAVTCAAGVDRARPRPDTLAATVDEWRSLDDGDRDYLRRRLVGRWHFVDDFDDMPEHGFPRIEDLATLRASE